MQIDMEKVVLQFGATYKRLWTHATNGVYSVKMATKLLLNHEVIFDKELCVSLWNSLLPSKVGILGWRACLDRLQTKDQLARRCIILNLVSLDCDLCSSHI